MITLTADEIADEVRAVFPALRSHRFEPLANSTRGEEPQSIVTEFRDKDDWTKLDAEWIDEAPDGWATALSFLSNEAICFYLPAYIIADLYGRLERVEPTFALIHGFDISSRDTCIGPDVDQSWTDYTKARWALLTRPQSVAVVHYLEWRVAKDRLGIETGIAEALETYWYDRAASAKAG